MQQGISASALVARTAGMTDEQILDLDLESLQAGDGGLVTQGAPAESAGGPGDFSDVWNDAALQAPKPAAVTQPSSAAPSGDRAGVQEVRSNPQDEPGWLKQLEAQPAAAAEARQWRDAAQNVAALDAAYFSGDSGARSGLAARLYENDPAAFREMLAESARMLASRDPQALTELARQLGMSQTQAPNAQAKSLAQAARSAEPNSVAQAQMSSDNSTNAVFPAEAYRAFESAANDDVARSTREAIDRTLSSTLPEGIGEGARRRIGDDIFHELHATLSADRELSRQVGEILRGWHFDGATRQQIVSLISSRARSAMPEVARRVVAEWTSSVLASDRARAARVDAAASRRDITGGRVPDQIETSGLLPRKVDYSRMSDEQILDL
jgi:hypothetical protein